MNILLTALAVLPAMVLCIYVFKKDRVEKEPTSLLLLLFFCGMFSCFPAACVEGFLIHCIEMLFRPFGNINANGDIIVPTVVFYIYNFIKYFFVVALVEELFKLLILYFVTKKNDNFNCLFDGIIYAVFVSLGFAALENVFYVLENGVSNALMRAVLSVPAHMFFAVMMGYYYTFWHIEDKAFMMERKLRKDGVVSRGTRFFPGSYQYKSLLVPVLAHGLYDFCCTAGTTVALIVFLLFVAFMYISCFRKIKTMSFADGYSTIYAKDMLAKKYPELEGYIQEEL